MNLPDILDIIGLRAEYEIASYKHPPTYCIPPNTPYSWVEWKGGLQFHSHTTSIQVKLAPAWIPLKEVDLENLLFRINRHFPGASCFYLLEEAFEHIALLITQGSFTLAQPDLDRWERLAK